MHPVRWKKLKGFENKKEREYPAPLPFVHGSSGSSLRRVFADRTADYQADFLPVNADVHFVRQAGYDGFFQFLQSRFGRGILLPAALGAAALLVGAALTPVLTLSAVVEGGRSLFPNAFPAPGTRALVITAVLLLSLLFFSQGFDSRRTERLLDPLTLLWLLFIGAAGAVQLPGARAVLRAFDPRLGLRFLFAAKDPTGRGWTA